jgi:EF-hand domain pair/EF hand
MTWTLKLAAVGLALAALTACTATRNTVDGMLGRDQGFGGLDMDGDGALTPTEAQALPDLAQAFDQLDTNDDGDVDRNEFRAGNTMTLAANFGQLDINGDGVISQREADASRPSLRETFDDVDADGDGNVSNAEYRAATTNLLKGVDFTEADRDGDGVLDPNEVKQHPLVQAHFDRMDVNNDSLVGPDEFRRAQGD